MKTSVFPNILCFLMEIQVLKIFTFNVVFKKMTSLCSLDFFATYFLKKKFLIYSNDKEFQEVLNDIGWIFQF